MSLIIDIRNDDKIPTNHFDVREIFSYLSQNYNYKTISIHNLTEYKDNVDDFFFNKYNEKLRNIIIFSHLKYLSLNFNVSDDVQLILYGEDMHTIKNRNLLPRFNKIILSSGYCLSKYHNISSNNIYYFPHSACFDIEFNDDPLTKILVSGRNNKTIYPKRYIAFTLSKEHDNIDYLHVNFYYRMPKETDLSTYSCGVNYIKKLNEYLVCFSCDANKDRPYILTKNFEILSSGALLLLAIDTQNKKYFEQLGFIDGVHYISCQTDNIKKMIEYCLDDDNRKIVNEIRKNGYEFVRKNHMYNNRAELFNKIIEENIDLKEYSDGIDGTAYKLAFIENQ